MKLLSALLGALLLSNVALANSDEANTQLVTPSADTASNVVDEAADSTACAAYTTCFDGRQIGCTANGYNTRCQRNSWQVLCEAWGAYGQYSRSYNACN